MFYRKRIKNFEVFEKIFGTKKDYIIIFSNDSKGQNEEPKINEQIPKHWEQQGINRFDFRVLQDQFKQWKRLDMISPTQLRQSRHVNIYMSGDLNRNLKEFGFEGIEENYLSCQLIRIISACYCVPSSYYKFEEDIKDIQVDNEAMNAFFQTKEDVQSLENWVHRFPIVLKSGRIKHFLPLHRSEEDKEQLKDELDEKDLNCDRLRILSKDTENLWNFRYFGNKDTYTEKSSEDDEEKLKQIGNVVLSNKNWNGAMNIFSINYQSTMFLYIGYGFKNPLFSLQNKVAEFQVVPKQRQEQDEPNHHEEPELEKEEGEEEVQKKEDNEQQQENNENDKKQQQNQFIKFLKLLQKIMINFSTNEKNFYFLELEGVKQIQTMFNYQGNVFAIVETRSGFFLVNKEKKTKLEGKISQIYYVEDEKSIIMLREQEIVIYSLSLQSEINILPFDWKQSRKNSIKMGRINENEFYIMIQYQQRLQYCYFDFYEVNEILKSYDEEIKRVDISSQYLMIQFGSKIFLYDLFFENKQRICTKYQDKSQYFILGKNLFQIKKGVLKRFDVMNQTKFQIEVNSCTKSDEALNMIYQDQYLKVLKFDMYVLLLKEDSYIIKINEFDKSNFKIKKQISKYYYINDNIFAFVNGQNIILCSNQLEDLENRQQEYSCIMDTCKDLQQNLSQFNKNNQNKKREETQRQKFILDLAKSCKEQIQMMKQIRNIEQQITLIR